MELSSDRENAARAESLLREAHVLRMRRQFAQAETKCREALALRPEDVGGLEMLGDLLAEKGSLQEAAETYQRAIERAPGRAPLEQKHARLVLEMGEQQHQRVMTEQLLQNPRSAAAARPRNPGWAFMLSALWPGLGQFYNHEVVKGMVLAAGSLFAMLLGGDSLLSVVFAMMGRRGGGATGASVFGFVFLSLWIYSMIDAPIQAQKASRGGNAGRF